MPKSYEEEIRDLLRGMDRFPGEQPRRPRRWAWPSWRGFGPLNGQRIMGGALILMLFAWILQGPSGFPGLRVLAGYISLASLVLFITALVVLVRSGTFGGGLSALSGRRDVRWRGQVIQMPRRGGLLGGVKRWWRKLTSRGPGRPRKDGPGPRGRDSLQW